MCGEVMTFFLNSQFFFPFNDFSFVLINPQQYLYKN